MQIIAFAVKVIEKCGEKMLIRFLLKDVTTFDI